MENVNILLIEDNSADKDYIDELLSDVENIDYNIYWKQRLNKGLSFYEANEIDVVLLDLSLPDSHGIDTFLKANSVIKNDPIIILTGLEKEQVGIKCIKKGAQDYLFKNHINKYILKKSITYSIERKKGENEIAWLRDYLSNIIDSMPSILVAIDRNYKVVHWNQRAENFVKTKRKNAIGKNLFNIFSLLMHYKNEIDNCLNKNEIKTIKEEKINIEGDNYYFNITAFSLNTDIKKRGANFDHNAGAVIRLDNITEYIKLKEKYEQSQKMESLGQLTGGVAHDLNNILGGIQNACHILKNKKYDRKKCDKYLKMIDDLTARASDLTNKLLNFSRTEHVSDKVINLKKLINGVIEILKSNLNKKIQINSEYNLNKPYIKGNYSQLQTVLLNLGLNSLDAIDDSGFVKYIVSSVNLKNSNIDKLPGIKLNKDYVNITIKDNGKGIPENVQNKILEPFFTTKDKKEGTGLGLSSAHGIIKNHEGVLDFKSKKNKGTEFYIYLPQFKKSKTNKNNKLKNNKKSTYEGSILVIDDEEAVRSTTKELLEISGFNVLTAENGNTALDIFNRKNEKIDIVILDMVMPDMNGNECFDKLKEINSDIPVIIVSGYSSIESRKELKNKGVKSFISKPFDIGELSEKVSKILSEK